MINMTSEFLAISMRFISDFKYAVAFVVLVMSVIFSEYLAKFVVKQFGGDDSENTLKSRMKVFTTLFVSLVRTFFILAVATWLLYRLGFSTSTIVGTLAIVVAGMTLALQDAARNIIAGVSMVIYDYYRIGDLVNTNSVLGFVRAFDVFSTTIEDGDSGSLHRFPNTSIWLSSFENYSKVKTIVVIHKFLVSHNNDTKELEKIVRNELSTVKGVIGIHSVGFANTNDRGMTIQTKVFCSPNDFMDVSSGIGYTIMNLLNQQGVYRIDGLGQIVGGPTSSTRASLNGSSMDSSGYTTVPVTRYGEEY